VEAVGIRVDLEMVDDVIATLYGEDERKRHHANPMTHDHNTMLTTDLMAVNIYAGDGRNSVRRYVKSDVERLLWQSAALIAGSDVLLTRTRSRQGFRN
jgi:hypothetical protein